MTSRRTFLHTISTSLLASAALPLTGGPVSAGAAGLVRPFKAGLALQLYSLRHRLNKGDVDGALALTRKFGFTDVEGNAPDGMTTAAFAARLKAHGLAAMGTGVDFGALAAGKVAETVADAHALGAKYVMCAWIPHGPAFTQADVDKAVPLFNAAGAACRDAGLTFMYHTHGYEFVPGPGGTLFDTLASRTDPTTVGFEMDVFWVVRGGAQPLQLLEKYPGRVKATHVKDMKKGTPVGDHSGGAPEDTNVPVGEGTIDWKTLFAACEKAGVAWHIIEDESPDVEQQIPRSLAYIASLAK
jgi:sugar phosphate isomerase/epimerase